MACLDHHCGDCHYEWMDNDHAAWCPKCCSPYVTNVFDEPREDHEDVPRYPRLHVRGRVGRQDDE